MRKIILLLVFLTSLLTISWNPGVFAQEEMRQVLVLSLEGPLTPSWIEYIERGIQVAEQRRSEAIILEINTPGGSISLMQEIVEKIRGSQIPIIVYVTPRGAMAASAGTVITLAGHASAMAPETIIGAASPVGAQGEELGETIATKEKNALRAQVRTLARNRGQEAIALAESTIEDAIAVSSDEALEVNLVDFIARDVHDLLSQLDGYRLEMDSGIIELKTANAELSRMELSFIEQILSVLTNPNIVFVLLTIGVQAILIEISSPGGWVAGFIGVVCLSLAVYGLGALPVNWFGLIFLATAFVLFILDIKAPTHGALTVAGVTSLIVGALVLFNSPITPQFQRVSVPLVVITSLITGGVFAAAVAFAIRAQRTPIRMGEESLIGRVGTVRLTIPKNGYGQVHVAGEMWTAELAEGENSLEAGTRVKVVSIQGVRLKVRAEEKFIQD